MAHADPGHGHTKGKRLNTETLEFWGGIISVVMAHGCFGRVVNIILCTDTERDRAYIIVFRLSVFFLSFFFRRIED